MITLIMFIMFIYVYYVCFTYNIESAITFAIFEKEKQKKHKILMWFTCLNVSVGIISNAPEVY